MAVDALPVPGTVSVSPASHHDATIERITAVSTETPAFGSSAVHIAFRVDSAGISDQARVDAVAVDASLAVSALGIRTASYHLTGDVRVAVESFLARADRAVASDKAGGVRAAVAGVATEPIDARLAVRTVVV